jgi:predicted type IV restriction endonuclease
VPEYAVEYADVKNELIDYAILHDEQPIILIECKPCTENLNKKHVAQLINYYLKIEGGKFGILTNGIICQFYTDIGKVNLLAEDPFLELDILKMKIPDINEMEMFFKTNR